MKIKAISDLHGNLIDPGHCDLLLVCGDISPLDMQRDHMQMFKWVFGEFVDWVNKLLCERVCLTPGNHDFWFEKFCTPNMVNALRGATHGKLEVLINRQYDYYFVGDEGEAWYKIYGTPACARFGNWAYMDFVKMVEDYDNIPEDLDILITHQPSTLVDTGASHWDDGTKSEYGSYYLTDAILRAKPRYALCGHVHTGNHKITKVNGVRLANCSLLDEKYNLAFKPIEFDITPGQVEQN